MSRKESHSPDNGQKFNHHHIEQLLSNYRFLTPDEQRQIETHLTTCADCRRQLATFQEMDQRLQQSEWLIPKRRLRAGFYAAVERERDKQASFWVGKWSMFGGLASQIGSLALLTVMVVIIWFLARQQNSVPAINPLPTTIILQQKMTLTESGRAGILTLSDDGYFLALAQGNQIQVWATFSGRLLETLDMGAETPIDMAFTPNDLVLAVQTATGQLIRWRVAGGIPLAGSESLPLMPPSHPFAISNDHLALVTGDNQIELRDLATGELQQTIAKPESIITDIIFAADGDMLLAGDNAGNIHRWDLNAGTNSTITGFKQPIVSLVATPLADQIAVSFADGSVKLWSQTKGHTLPAREGKLLDMRFFVDGNHFFRLFQDGAIEHWVIADAQLDSVLTAPPLRRGEFAFLPQGLILAGITADGRATLWEKPEHSDQ